MRRVCDVWLAVVTLNIYRAWDSGYRHHCIILIPHSQSTCGYLGLRVHGFNCLEFSSFSIVTLPHPMVSSMVLSIEAASGSILAGKSFFFKRAEHCETQSYHNFALANMKSLPLSSSEAMRHLVTHELPSIFGMPKDH